MEDLQSLPLTLTVNETAVQLRVTKRMVYTLMERGELRSIKVGRTRRITRQALAEYIRNLEAAS